VTLEEVNVICERVRVDGASVVWLIRNMLQLLWN